MEINIAELCQITLIEDDAVLLNQGTKRICQLCKIKMDNICKLYNMGSLIDLGEGWGETPYENRRYDAYECPKCGVLLLFRKSI